MLNHKVEACAASIDELSDLRTHAMSLSDFEKAVNKLAAVDTMIADFVSTVEEMNKTDFCKINLSTEDIETLKYAIISCADSVNKKALKANDVAALTSIFQTQKNMLTVLWNSTAKAYVDPIRSYLGVIQSFVPNKDEVSNLIKALGTGSTAEPSAAIVKTLAANVQKANAITSNFQMSNSVRSFLEKAKNGKATYTDITPDVSNWITQHKLGSRIKISF